VTSYAESARAEPRRRRASAAERPAEPRVRRAARARPRSTLGGVVWIVLVAVLLAGVVAINVAVLRLNVRLDEASRHRLELQADVARLQSDLSSAGASAQISAAARERLGLVVADPSSTRYLKLEP
jgi:cell division protein FtsL